MTSVKLLSICFCLHILSTFMGSLVCAESIHRPNIVFILADDYGWNDIGYHGSEIQTPYLDSLAADGVKLENYYVQPICTPSRSQLLSGRYQIHTGLQHHVIDIRMPSGLPLSEPTLADKLKEAGYKTHMTGKWHLGFYKEAYVPTSRGFDTFLGHYGGKKDYYTHELAKGGYHGVDFRNQTVPSNDSYGEYSLLIFAREAQKIIESHDKAAPMFLYLAPQSPHDPLQVPEQYEKMYSHIKDRKRRIFAGMVTAMDEAVGNVTRSLKKSGLWNNTVLVFSADNGGHPPAGGDNAPLRGGKMTYWEGGIRGVAFVSSPLLKKPKRISRDLIHISDWFPTLIGLAGGSMNGTKPDGVDQWETITNGAHSNRNEILYNIDPLYRRRGVTKSPIFDTSIQASLRQGDWKILTGDPGADGWSSYSNDSIGHKVTIAPAAKSQNVFLFNVTADPTEQYELSSQHPEVVASLLQRLADYQKTAIPVFYPPHDPQCDPDLHGGYWSPWVCDGCQSKSRYTSGLQSILTAMRNISSAVLLYLFG